VTDPGFGGGVGAIPSFGRIGDFSQLLCVGFSFFDEAIASPWFECRIVFVIRLDAPLFLLCYCLFSSLSFWKGPAPPGPSSFSDFGPGFVLSFSFSGQSGGLSVPRSWRPYGGFKRQFLLWRVRVLIFLPFYRACAVGMSRRLS